MMRGLALLALTKVPARWIGRSRQQGVDAALDPQIAAVLELQRRMKLTALETNEPVRARAIAEEGLALLDVAPAPMASIEETTAGGVPVTLYTPPEAGPHLIVYFHGGGGVIGSVKGSEPVTRLLAAQTRCTVASVEYRLGPEHKHPAAIEDAVAATTALRTRARGKLVVAGDSFGGFLATHVARRTRVELQVLIYPLVDATMAMPSIARLADGYLLTRSLIEWFRRHYFGAEHEWRPASPLFWEDLGGSAPAIVITAGFDPLVDEGDRYAEALRAAGVPVIHRRYPSLTHSFLSLAGGVKAARGAIDTLCQDLARKLGDPDPGDTIAAP